MLVIITSLVQGSCSQMARSRHPSEFLAAGSPDAPVPLTPTNDSSTEDMRPEFRWTESSGASSYTLQLDTNTTFSSSDLILMEEIQDTSVTLSTELSYGRWFWRVRAENASGAGSFSDIMVLTILPSRLTNVTDGVMNIVVIIASVAGITGIALKIANNYRSGMHDRRILDSARILSPVRAGSVVLLVGLLAPYALKYQSFTDPPTSELYMMVNFVAVPWFLLIETDSWRLELIPSAAIGFSALILILHLIFVLEVVGYCQERATKAKVFGAWLLSQLPVIVMSLTPFLAGAYPGSLFYSGPTFITLAVGYIMMRISGPPTLKKPWVEQ